MKLINVGFGNMVCADKIVAIVGSDSAPIKRIIRESEDKGMLINATYGRRTRSVIVAQSGHIILSSVQPETIVSRIESESEAAHD